MAIIGGKRGRDDGAYGYSGRGIDPVDCSLLHRYCAVVLATIPNRQPVYPSACRPFFN